MEQFYEIGDLVGYQKVGDLIKQCFIIYESGVLEDLQRAAWFNGELISFMGTLAAQCLCICKHQI